MGKKYQLTINGQRGDTVHFEVGGKTYAVEISPKSLRTSSISSASLSAQPSVAVRPAEQNGSGSAHLIAPMPGLVVSVQVKEGQKVSAGDQVLVLEAMKMENAVPAHRDATIAKVLVKPGQQVESGAVLIELS
ncbi:MAG: biotin/lipoyl-binding protein [Bdellovibrionales bacterium]|nr:biotin/lipoyl-binding protein [Bdellovibrionales bacterium]